MHKILTGFSQTYISLSLVGLSLALAPANSFSQDRSFSLSPPVSILANGVDLNTQSSFDIREKTVTKKIPFEKKVIMDEEMERGEEKVVEEGQSGTQEVTTKEWFWHGQLFTREVKVQLLEEPKDQVIRQGTRVVIREKDTPAGRIRYHTALRVYATAYDKNCSGCNETTSTGLKAGKGVIAVDPSVIPLGSRVYVEEYGFAVAGDVGGSIQGNIVDLGFDDARTSGWRSHYTTLYILQ